MSFKIHITNLADSKKSIQLLLSTIQEKFIQKTSAVIQIDLAFPQTHPVTTNPEILSYVVEELINAGMEKIWIVGTSYYKLSSKKIWKSMGYDEFITERFPNVEFLPIEESNVEKSSHVLESKRIQYPKVIENAEIFISIVNPKASLYFDLGLSIENSVYLLNYEDRREFRSKSDQNYCENDVYLKRLTQLMLETHFIRPPDVILYDFTCILTDAGPLLYSDSSFQYSSLFMLSENSVIGDLVALLLCDKSTDENPLIEAIKNFDYSLISQDLINQYKIAIIDELEENFQEINLSGFFSKDEIKPKHSLKFWKKKEQEELKSINIFKGLNTFIDIFGIFPQKAEICKGIMCSGCKKAAIELLLMLKTSMHKDQETMPEFSLLVGKNPIEPKNEYCIVFGDHAIDTTTDRKFRKKIIDKNLRSEKDMELDRARLKIKLQKKIVELESHEDIIKEETPEGPKRDRAIKKLRRKIAFNRRINDQRLKLHDKYIEHNKIRNDKIKDYETVKKNNHVLEIQGCPPEILQHLGNIVNLFKKRWVPGLSMKENFLLDFAVNSSSQKVDESGQKDEMEMES